MKQEEETIKIKIISPPKKKRGRKKQQLPSHRICIYCAYHGILEEFIKGRNICKDCSFRLLKTCYYTTSKERRDKHYKNNKKYYDNLSIEKKKKRLLRISKLRRDKTKIKKLKKIINLEIINMFH